MHRWILRGVATAGFAAGAWLLSAAPAQADDPAGTSTRTTTVRHLTDVREPRHDGRASVRADLRTNYRAAIPAGPRADQRAAVRAGLRADHRAPTRAGLRADLRAGLRGDLRAGVPADLRAGVRAGLRADLRAGLRAGGRADRDAAQARATAGSARRSGTGTERPARASVRPFSQNANDRAVRLTAVTTATRRPSTATAGGRAVVDARACARLLTTSRCARPAKGPGNGAIPATGSITGGNAPSGTSLVAVRAAATAAGTPLTADACVAVAVLGSLGGCAAPPTARATERPVVAACLSAQAGDAPPGCGTPAPSATTPAIAAGTAARAERISAAACVTVAAQAAGSTCTTPSSDGTTPPAAIVDVTATPASPLATERATVTATACVAAAVGDNARDCGTTPSDGTALGVASAATVSTDAQGVIADACLTAAIGGEAPGCRTEQPAEPAGGATAVARAAAGSAPEVGTLAVTGCLSAAVLGGARGCAMPVQGDAARGDDVDAALRVDGGNAGGSGGVVHGIPTAGVDGRLTVGVDGRLTAGADSGQGERLDGGLAAGVSSSPVQADGCLTIGAGSCGEAGNSGSAAPVAVVSAGIGLASRTGSDTGNGTDGGTGSSVEEDADGGTGGADGIRDADGIRGGDGIEGADDSGATASGVMAATLSAAQDGVVAGPAGTVEAVLAAAAGGTTPAQTEFAETVPTATGSDARTGPLPRTGSPLAGWALALLLLGAALRLAGGRRRNA